MSQITIDRYVIEGTTVVDTYSGEIVATCPSVEYAQVAWFEFTYPVDE
jgi:hypothetical protein